MKNITLETLDSSKIVNSLKEEFVSNQSNIDSTTAVSSGTVSLTGNINGISNSSSISGLAANTAGNVGITSGTTNPYISYGYCLSYPYPYYYSYPATNSNVSVAKVENGFLLTHNNKQYVAKTEPEVAKLMIKLLAGENKKKVKS